MCPWAHWESHKCLLSFTVSSTGTSRPQQVLPRAWGDACGQLLAGIRLICPCQVLVLCPFAEHFYVLITSHIGNSCSFSSLSKRLLPFNLWFLKLPASGSQSWEMDSCLLDQSISLISKSTTAKAGVKRLFGSKLLFLFFSFHFPFLFPFFPFFLSLSLFSSISPSLKTEVIVKYFLSNHTRLLPRLFW